MEAILPLSIRMYNLFRKNLNLSEAQAQEFVQVIDEAVKEQGASGHEHTLELVHKDMQSLKEYIDVKFDALDDRFSTLDNKFASKVDLAQTNLKIESTKSDIIKWMFIFWIGQIAATLGVIFLFLKK